MIGGAPPRGGEFIRGHMVDLTTAAPLALPSPMKEGTKLPSPQGAVAPYAAVQHAPVPVPRPSAAP